MARCWLLGPVGAVSGGVSVKAVAVGCVIDLGGTLLADFLFTTTYTVILIAQGVPEADLQRRILADEGFYVVSLILDLGFLAGGAFVAARIARGREVMHAGLVGVVAIVTGLFFLLLTADTGKWPSWYLPVSFGFTLPVALLAGYVAKRRATNVDERAA